MTARASLYQLLDNDIGLAALGFEKVYATNAVDTPLENRFIVLRWEPTGSRVYGQKAAGRATVWFHDRDRDYGQIDLAIERFKAIIRDAVHVDGGDGWVLTAVDWNSDGPDLSDEGFGTVVRWSDITVVSRYDGL